MASKLVLSFKDANGGTRNWNYNYADPDVTAEQVKTTMQVMIDNGSIFEHPPITMASAKVVTTTEKGLDIS